jgi:hypothetical protein
MADHALEVRVGDVDEVLRAGIVLRCSCGWTYTELPLPRAVRRHGVAAAVIVMAARAEGAWQAHQSPPEGGDGGP